MSPVNKLLHVRGCDKIQWMAVRVGDLESRHPDFKS